MQEIYTSSWRQYRGKGRIGICRGNPRGMPAGYRMYKALAPTWDILNTSESKTDYEPRFMKEILAPLNPAKVVDDLRKLAGDHPPVLLCFEVPPFTHANFCHRHMVANWLIAHGYECREWSGVKESNLEQARLDI